MSPWKATSVFRVGLYPFSRSPFMVPVSPIDPTDLNLIKRSQISVNRPRNNCFSSGCPAVTVLALRERPSPIDLCVSSLFVTGESVMTGQKLSTQRSANPQTTITDPTQHPRRRKRSSRRSRRAKAGFCVAVASWAKVFAVACLCRACEWRAPKIEFSDLACCVSPNPRISCLHYQLQGIAIWNSRDSALRRDGAVSGSIFESI